MRLNIKNPNTKIVMYEKKSNTTSIVIAIVAIFLILGGVYMINQSFNKTKTDTTAKSDSNTTTNTTKSNETAKTETKSDTTEDDTTTTNSSSTTTSDTTTTPSTDTATTDSDTTTTDPDTTTTPTESTLKEDEAIVKVTKVTPGTGGANRYDITIVDTGYKDGTKLKKDATTYINVSGVTMQADKTYQISSITEKDGKISISSLKAIEITS